MFILLIGFITPAIIFAIFGIIACLRRSSFVAIDCEEDKEYEILDSNIPIRVEVPKPYYSYFGLNFPPIGYQNFFPAPTVGMPPSYSEATSIPLLEAPERKSRKSSAESQTSTASSSSRHLPRNAPKIRPIAPPHITIQMENYPMIF